MQSGGTCWAAAREAGEGGGQVSEAVVLSTIILLRIYESKIVFEVLRCFWNLEAERQNQLNQETTELKENSSVVY